MGREVALRAVLRTLEPELLFLQECQDWTAEQLHSFAGLPYSELGLGRLRGSGARYNVGVASRWPLKVLGVHNNPAFLGHCLLEFEVEGLHCFAPHFDSSTENMRFVEARFVRSLLSEGPALLAGDLNCIAPLDPYPADLEELLRRADVHKFSFPPRMDVYAELREQGWQDALYAKGRPMEWITAPRDRGGVHIDYRTDYILTRGLEVSSCRVHTLQHEESDHYPVVAEITWPAAS